MDLPTIGVVADEPGVQQVLEAQLALVGERLVPGDAADYLFWLSSKQPSAEQVGRSLLREEVAGASPGAALGTFPWPLSLDQLEQALSKLHRHARTVADEKELALDELVGTSPGILKLRQRLLQVAGSESTVLLTGASGTGKSFVAKLIHRYSKRSDRAFVPINCGAIPAELMESELFGHERGAFTGALAQKPGRFELAAGGTLFLDEVGELPLPLQVKLLRALQERAFERVGGVETLEADVRVVAATNADLETLMGQRLFREDLYYRLNVFPIELPSLADRAGDLPALVTAMQSELSATLGGRTRLTASAMERLATYRWPGNLRELRNLLERLYVEFGDSLLEADDLPDWLQARERQQAVASVEMPSFAGARLPVNGIDLKSYLSGLEQQLIEQALWDSDNVVARAADRLQIRRTTLVEKMRKYGIERGN